MQEALILFESISNSPWFTKTTLILFLNKMDLFRAKLETSPIPQYFPDYEGDFTDLKVASKFFQNKFLALSRSPKKVIEPKMPVTVPGGLLFRRSIPISPMLQTPAS